MKIFFYILFKFVLYLFDILSLYYILTLYQTVNIKLIIYDVISFY